MMKRKHTAFNSCFRLESINYTFYRVRERVKENRYNLYIPVSEKICREIVCLVLFSFIKRSGEDFLIWDSECENTTTKQISKHDLVAELRRLTELFVDGVNGLNQQDQICPK
jgi:hypothetical protein